MIRLKRPPKPEQLTDITQLKLTEKYINNTSLTVWNQPFIRETLLNGTQHKCCYCEKQIGLGFPDMHIDHYRPKSLYPDLVVEWDNLMPCCGDCNRSKSNHDTVKMPIVNPFIDEPKNYFFLKDFRYKAIDNRYDSVANTTINILGLNDLDKKCKNRYIIVTKILDDLNALLNNAQRNKDVLKTDIALSNSIKRRLCGILRLCTPEAEYSAFVATAVLHDVDYRDLKELLVTAGCWSDELQKLETNAMPCVYRTVR